MSKWIKKRRPCHGCGEDFYPGSGPVQFCKRPECQEAKKENHRVVHMRNVVIYNKKQKMKKLAAIPVEYVTPARKCIYKWKEGSKSGEPCGADPYPNYFFCQEHKDKIESNQDGRVEW